MSSTVVNGKMCEIIRPDESLLAFLRSELGLARVKGGCGECVCGACTVLVDGRPTLACHLRADQVAGRSVATIEGLADSASEPLHPVQRADRRTGLAVRALHAGHRVTRYGAAGRRLHSLPLMPESRIR